MKALNFLRNCTIFRLNTTISGTKMKNEMVKNDKSHLPSLDFFSSNSKV